MYDCRSLWSSLFPARLRFSAAFSCCLCHSASLPSFRQWRLLLHLSVPASLWPAPPASASLLSSASSSTRRLLRPPANATSIVSHGECMVAMTTRGGNNTPRVASLLSASRECGLIGVRTPTRFGRSAATVEAFSQRLCDFLGPGRPSGEAFLSSPGLPSTQRRAPLRDHSKADPCSRSLSSVACPPDSQIHTLTHTTQRTRFVSRQKPTPLSESPPSE